MNYALGRAAESYVADLERYGIKVFMVEGRIEYQNRVTLVKPYTPKVVCKRLIRQYIKEAKAQEQAIIAENQSNLFGDQL